VAILRYDLFSINPLTAAESTLAIMYDALLLVDLEGRIVSVNRRTSEMLGYKERELLNSRVDVLIPQVQQGNFANNIRAKVFSGKSVQDGEIELLSKGGDLIPISISATAVCDQRGTLQGIVYVARDLTARKQAERRIINSLREKEVLIQEIHHRVKNNLQLISSLLNLQIDEHGDPRVNQILLENRQRVQSMARVHDQLYSSGSLAELDLREYTQNLIDAISTFSISQKGPIKINLDIPDVSLNIDKTIYYGLIINELTVNALKHAFPDQHSGEITITLTESGEKALALTVSDNGVGLPEGVDQLNGNSLGLSLVEMLTTQLEGNFSIVNSEEGASFVITFNNQ
jgi:PAS domain S-box-containing protein